jgi:YNFM family putative membrane transporter
MSAAAAAPPATAHVRAEPGSPAARRIGLALFLAGFATFSLLYCVQPLLPRFAEEFDRSPAASALALSGSTGALAFAILVTGAWSQGLDRRRLMFASLVLASLLDLVAAVAPGWHALLAVRTLEGLALGGVPAVAMAYLADEIAPHGLGRAMGRYVGGTAFGGMTGRVLVGALADAHGWRVAVGLTGVLGLGAALAFLWLLPRHDARPVTGGMAMRDHVAAWRGHLRRGSLRALFAIAFLAMGVFVSVYNFAGFRLMAPPFGLGQAAIGALFTVYVFGIVSSTVGGALADRWGRFPVLATGLAITAAGVALTLPDRLPAVVAGLVLLTIGFFITHAVASAWVGRLAGTHAGHASSLYLLAYYLGSSVLGAAGGSAWSAGRWPALAGASLVALALAGAAAWTLRRADDRPPSSRQDPRDSESRSITA